MSRPKKVVPNPPAPGQPDLAVQAAVEEPIINSPFEEPKWWWSYDKQGKAIKQPGRREASYFWTTQKVMTGQQSLEGVESDFGSEKLELVNWLREDVAQ
jgi:type III restriction enzyme